MEFGLELTNKITMGGVFMSSVLLVFCISYFVSFTLFYSLGMVWMGRKGSETKGKVENCQK
jgi:hypothetical protein